MARAPSKAAAPQASIEDDARAKRNAQIVKRLETMRNWVADVESKLPGMHRELDALIEEMRRR